jgi:hypothetical protein
MGLAIAADDLEVGQAVIVLQHRLSKLGGSEAELLSEMDTCLNHVQPLAPPGTPLEIRALSLPFVLCTRLAPARRKLKTVVVDSRRTLLGRLSPAFVDALRHRPDRVEEVKPR